MAPVPEVAYVCLRGTITTRETIRNQVWMAHESFSAQIQERRGEKEVGSPLRVPHCFLYSGFHTRFKTGDRPNVQVTGAVQWFGAQLNIAFGAQLAYQNKHIGFQIGALYPDPNPRATRPDLGLGPG